MNDFLDGKKFLLGDRPCNEDSALFGMICQLIYHETGPFNQFVKSIINLKYIFIFNSIFLNMLYKMNAQISYHTSNVSKQNTGLIGINALQAKNMNRFHIKDKLYSLAND